MDFSILELFEFVILSRVSFLKDVTCWTFGVRVRPRFFDQIGHETKYRKVTSSNTSRLEAHAGFVRFLMKGIFDPYVL